MSDEPQLNTPLDVVIRPYDELIDEAYIYSSWRNSAFYSSVIDPKTRNSIEYFRQKNHLIKEILEHAVIKIACLKDSPEVIIGYSVMSGEHLNYIFVKPDFRLRGIGTMLYPKNVETVTDELTKIGIVLAQKKKLTLKGEYDDGTTRLTQN